MKPIPQGTAMVTKLSGSAARETLRRLSDQLPLSIGGRADRVAQGAAALVMGIGLLVLAGWSCDVTLLKSLSANMVSMKPNTALGFLFAGAGCLIATLDCANPQLRRWRYTAATGAFALGASAIFEWVLAIDLGIDEVHFLDDPSGVGTQYPGRMTAWTALNFVLCGAALLLLDVRSVASRSIPQSFATLSCVPVILSMVGYAFGIEQLYGVGQSVHIAVLTNVAFALLAVGILAARLERESLKSAAKDFGIGILAAAFSFLTWWLLRPLIGRQLPFVMYWPAIIFAAWYGGFRGGFLTTLLAGLAVTFFIFEPRWSLAVADPAQRFGMGLFLALGTALSLFVERAKLNGRLRIDADARARSFLAASNYYRSVIEVSLDPLVIFNAAGKITDVNAATEKATGYSRQVLIGNDFSNYFLDPNHPRTDYAEVFRTRVVQGRPLVIRHRDGFTTPVLYNASLYRDESGQVIGACAAARDISQLRRAEAETDRLAAIVESTGDAIISEALDGVILTWNQGAERLFGYTAAEAVGQPFSLLIPPLTEAECSQVCTALRRGENCTNYETALRRKDGGLVPVSVSIGPVTDVTGQTIGFARIARDITDLARAQERLQQAMWAAERASEAKDVFLASMSHELRTPLNAIIGFTGTLLMKLPGELNEDQEQQLQTIETSATHLLSLINDILDLCKIESGKVELRSERLPCSNIVQEIATTLRPLAESKDLAFEIDMPADLVVYSDRRALMQILLNLAGNAIKFTDEGRVLLRISQRLRDQRAVTEFQVVDTGIGIQPADQAKLFHAFERLTPGRQPEGCGLGLHLSRKLAQLLGGEIHLESELGRGSTFTLVLEDGRAVPRRVPQPELTLSA